MGYSQLTQRGNDYMKPWICWKTRLDDLENGSHRNNLRRISLLEPVPASAHKMLIWPTAGPYCPRKVEQAHHVGNSMLVSTEVPSKLENNPRQTFMQFLVYTDKEDIICAFPSHKKLLLLKGRKVILFICYFASVMRKRKAFTRVCLTLYKWNIKFQRIYQKFYEWHSQTACSRYLKIRIKQSFSVLSCNSLEWSSSPRLPSMRT